MVRTLADALTDDGGGGDVEMELEATAPSGMEAAAVDEDRSPFVGQLVAARGRIEIAIGEQRSAREEVQQLAQIAQAQGRPIDHLLMELSGRVGAALITNNASIDLLNQILGEL